MPAAGTPVAGARRSRVRAGDRTKRVATDVTEVQHRALKRMAEADGMTLGSWLYLRLGEMVNNEGGSSEEGS